METQMPITEEDLQSLSKTDSLSREPYWLLKRPENLEEDNIPFGRIFSILRRRAALIASVAVIATTGAAYFSSTRTHSYEGKFQLLVEPLRNSESELLVLLSQTLQQDVNKITRDNTTALDYQALLEVLKSPKIIEPVVEEIQAKYPGVSYSKLVGGSNSGKVPSAVKDGTLHISRLSQGEIESRVIEIRYKNSNPDQVLYVLDKVSQAYRKYSLEQEQTNLRQGIKFVEQQIPKLRLRVNTLQGQMQLFQQNYNLFNPELQGEQLLNRVDQLQATKIEASKKLAESKSLYASLQKQLGMSQDSAIAASALSESPQYQEILKRVRDIEAEIATESVRLSDANPVMQSLRERRAKLIPLLKREAQLALGSNVAEELQNPQVGVYQNSVRRQLIQTMAETANQIQLLEASLKATDDALIGLNQQIKQYPVIAGRYANLQRELQVASDTLKQLLGKQEALRVDAAQQEVPWELIMPPRLPQDKNGNAIADASKGKLDIILGGVAGLLLGVLVAFLLENAQNVFHDSQEVKRSAKLPLLVTIPYLKAIKKLAPTEQELVYTLETEERWLLQNGSGKNQYEKASPYTQAFYSLYTRIQAFREQTNICSLVVTSATCGEGKSTVATTLAKTAAEAGLRVLLVDANLQNPQVHHSLGLVNTQGLSEILSQGLDLNDAIGQSYQEENLFVITAGEIPRNPAKLFSSPRMQNFVKRSQADFDLVVYDSPHILGRLDTSILTTHADGILMVVGLGKTVRPSLSKALDELKAGRNRILGLVTNTLES
ncbi:MAG: polysaccharide biosynthesis tyrosine autokinase [Richelia sp. RM2_1_2]|nr:polysaccharide biosynthesis tyrosine autokinase [Richelia sp. SM1_7_0]NJN09066.1 polysaccharide biosynthesis tyrosine autokinase [Richelia sp. RM1_1_1]NJO26827.1 polysaccharide biosynthesis tyrosine autokinase [Richelia sp. SL_2_1]NJO58599.1 polysaccharide biosynthesis tyrosine autokinase [Richelia sp. RM2_1_2]